jgi:hypothetical protein
MSKQTVPPKERKKLTVDKCFAVHCSRCGVLDVDLYKDLAEKRAEVLEKEHVCR